MAFKAGAIVGEADLDTKKWESGIGVIESTSKKAINLLGGLAKKGFMAVAAGMTYAVYQANEYQKEFSNVSTLVEMNTKDLQRMSIGLLSLNSNLGDTRELTRAMYDAISSGATPGKEAFDVVTASAKFAKAGVTDVASSVRLLSATLNAYGDDAKTMSGEQLTAAAASDIFFKTVEKGVITGEQLASTIGDSIPLFASMKIPVEQLASGMAAMTLQGVSAAESTTQLNAIVNSFLKPSEALTEVLKEQGYESGQLFIEHQGLTGALDLLAKATTSGGYEIADLTGNIRAMKGVLALSGEGAKIFNKTLDEMGTSAGATNRAFAKQEKTFTTLKNELNKTAIVAGNIGKFFIDDIAGGAQSALESINQFIISGRALEKIEPIISGIAGAFNVMKVFATSVYDLFKGTFVDVVSDIKKEFGELFNGVANTGTVFNALATVTDTLGAALNIVFRVVKLVVINFIDLAKISLSIIKTIGTLWEVIIGKKTWSEVKDSLSNVKNEFLNFGTDLKDNFVEIVSEGQKQWKELTDDTRTTADTFANSMKEGSEKAKNYLTANYNAMVSGAKKGNEEIVKSTVDTGNKLKSDIPAALETNKSAWQKWKDYVSANLKTVGDKVMFFSDVIFQGLNMALTGMSNISSQYFTNEFAKLDLATQQETEYLQEKYEADQAALDEQYANKIITEDQYNAQSQALKTLHENNINKIEEDSSKKKNQLAEKQFKQQKALAIAGIWVNYATAVMGFWAAYAKMGIPGIVIAGVLTGLATGLAVAQTALVARQQFVPSYAEGTEFHPGGAAIVGEEGPELAFLPRGSRVKTASETMDFFGGKEKEGITIHINNPVVRNDNDINKIADAVSMILGRRYRTA